MAFLSPIEFNVGLLSALNLSLPTNRAELRQILFKAAAKQQILAELSQILAKKTSQPFGKAADAFYPGLGLEAPRGPSPPDKFTPTLCLAPPPGLACPDRCKTGDCRKKGASGTDVYMDSITEDTSAGAGSMTLFATEGIEPEPEEFQMGADVRCFVTSSLSNNTRKVHSPHKATGVALPPGWGCADQVQQAGHCLPQETRRDPQLLKQINKQQQQKQQRMETRRDQQLLKQINKQQQQKQQRILEQRRRIIPLSVGIVCKL